METIHLKTKRLSIGNNLFPFIIYKSRFKILPLQIDDSYNILTRLTNINKFTVI